MIKSRKGQEGFTLIELLVVVLIIGILAAIAIPAFLGQKKGAQDSNAKSLVRNAAIAMESFYSENQDFNANGATLAADMQLIEPNATWQNAGPALAKSDQVAVVGSVSSTGVAGVTDRYILESTSASGNIFRYYRNQSAQTYRCKDVAGAAVVAFAAAAAGDTIACATGTW